MPKELDMVKMTPVKSKTTDFQQLCIHGSWEDVQRYLTDWRKTRVAELAGAFVSDTEKYRPYDGLVDAFRHGRLNIVKGLLGEGLSLQSDRDCNFALAAAAGAVRTGSSEILEFLLDQGWDPNHQDMPPLAGESYIQPQYSPISVVIKDESLVQLYLDHGVSPNAATFGGYTAISNACRSASVEIVQLLVSRGGDVMDKDVVAQAAEQYSQGVSGRLEVVRYVLDLGAPINMRANMQMGPLWDSWMSVMGADTALHYAARGGKEDMVRLLLERGADKSLKTSPRASHIGENKTALDIAEEKGFKAIADLLRNGERKPKELMGLADRAPIPI